MVAYTSTLALVAALLSITSLAAPIAVGTPSILTSLGADAVKGPMGSALAAEAESLLGAEGKTLLADIGARGLGLSPLALLGGPEGLALSLALKTKPGQQAEAYVEAEAEKEAKTLVGLLRRGPAPPGGLA